MKQQIVISSYPTHLYIRMYVNLRLDLHSEPAQVDLENNQGIVRWLYCKYTHI